MTFGMQVRLPVAGAVGSDADFDLRTQLERDFHAALVAEGAGECGLGEIDAGFMSIYLEAVSDPDAALRVVQVVLTRHNLLHQATVVLETPGEADPDDTERQTLWPPQPAPARVG